VGEGLIFCKQCDPAHTLISQPGAFLGLVPLDWEGAMHKISFALVFAAVAVSPASAQDYRKNFAECVKELGLQPDPSYTHKIESTGRTLRRWYFHSEAQAAVFNDCVARRASLAAKPGAKGQPPVSR
jgi:hypothetical protein